MSSRFGLSAPVLSLIAAIVVVGAFVAVQVGGRWDEYMGRQPSLSASDKALGNARDAQRRADVNTILNATHQYALEHDGVFPMLITATPTQVCGTVQEADGSYHSVPLDDCIDLFPLFADYLTYMPADPQAPPGSTWYRISKNKDGRVTVMAETHDGPAAIAVMR